MFNNLSHHASCDNLTLTLIFPQLLIHGPSLNFVRNACSITCSNWCSFWLVPRQMSSATTDACFFDYLTIFTGCQRINAVPLRKHHLSIQANCMVPSVAFIHRFYCTLQTSQPLQQQCCTDMESHCTWFNSWKSGKHKCMYRQSFLYRIYENMNMHINNIHAYIYICILQLLSCSLINNIAFLQSWVVCVNCFLFLWLWINSDSTSAL